MSIAMLQLPNANQINASNVVDTVKSLIIAMQELADQSGSRDTVLLGEMREEIHGLRLETRAGFERLNEQMQENSQRLDKHEKLLLEIKTEFIAEQKETNSLLRELLAKK